MQRSALMLYLFLSLAACTKRKIEEELKIPENINIEQLPTFAGGEKIQGLLIDKNINWEFPPISSLTEIVGGFTMYDQGEPLFILRKDTLMFVIGYKGKSLLPASAADIQITCKDDEASKIVDMIRFFKNNHHKYPANFMFQIWNKGAVIKSVERNYLENTIRLISYTLYKTIRNNKTIPVVLLKLKIKAVANNMNIFDGTVDFCYVPRAKTCE